MSAGISRSYVRSGILVIVGIVAASFYFHYNNDARVVQRRFNRLIESVSKSGHESLPVMAAKANKALSYFTTDAVIEPGYPVSLSITKSELKSLMLQARRQAASISIKSLGYELFKHGKDAIQMDVTLNIKVDSIEYNNKSLSSYRVSWVQLDDEWRISAIRHYDVVGHPERLNQQERD